MSTVTPRDLFFDQLRDIHSVEIQLVKSLPTLLERHPFGPLASLLAKHTEETNRHAQVVGEIFDFHGVEIGADASKAMEGLISGGDSHLDGVKVPETRDLMLIAHCLRIEHYEVAAYTIAARFAHELRLTDEASLLESILKEEKSAVSSLENIEPVLFERARQLVRS